MIGKNKLKILSVLSSISLWFYVMAVINPESTISFEGLPVNISNTLEIAENNLILSSESKPTVNIILEGKISDLRQLKKENVRVSMEIQNPSEGKNEAVLSVSVPSNIKYKLKEDTITTYLEKTIYDEYDISVELPKDKKASDYEISTSIESVKVSGPRSTIKKVDKVIAVIKEESFELNKDIGVQLKAVDSKGLDVENAILESSIIQVNIKKIEEKQIKIKPVFTEDIDINSIIINPSKISVSGESTILEGVTEILTRPIDTKKFNETGSTTVELIIPEGISLINKNSTEDSTALENSVLITLKK